MAHVRVLNHTADYAVTIKARSLEDLFSGGLEAINFYCAPCKPENLTTSKKYQIQIEEDNLEDLFVRFLNELLFVMEDNNVIIYTINYDKLSSCAVEAEVTALSKNRTALAGEIKCATYHNLKIEKKGGFIEAAVLFDV